MKKVLICLLVLSGCASTTNVDNAIDNLNEQIGVVEDSVNNLKQELPKECRTAKVLEQFSNIEDDIKALKISTKDVLLNYKAEAAQYKRANDKKSFIIFILLALIALYLYKKRHL